MGGGRERGKKDKQTSSNRRGGGGGEGMKGVCVCLSVCLSVTTLSATSIVSTLKKRYVEVYLGFSRFLTPGFWINPSV